MPAQHFIVRVGNYQDNWINRSDFHVWGFPTDAPLINKLRHHINQGNAVVWFLAPKDKMKHEYDGRIIAFCRPRRIQRRNIQDPTDQQLHWQPNLNTANTTNQTTFDWRMETGNIINVDYQDDSLKYDNLRRIKGSWISQASIHLIRQTNPLHRHLNLSFRRHIRRIAFDDDE
jgi:hypothetical protein